MDATLRKRKPRTLSFSLFESPRQFNENGENIAPILAASRQRRASVTQQHAPMGVQGSLGLDNMITEASINASKALAANLFHQNVDALAEDEVESGQEQNQRIRRMSTYSTGKTPTPSTVPTRKTSTVLNNYHQSRRQSECDSSAIQTLTERPEPTPKNSVSSAPPEIDQNGLISSHIIREYLAYLTGIAADKSKKWRLMPCDSAEKILTDQTSNLGIGDFDSFPSLCSALNMHKAPRLSSLAAFPLLYQSASRTRSDSNSSSSKCSSGSKAVSFWFGDVYPPPSVSFDGHESDSGASVSSITAATRDTQMDQLREVVRRLDTDYALASHYNQSALDCQRYAVSGSATPMYRGKGGRRTNQDVVKTRMLADDLAARLGDSACTSCKPGGRMPDLTQVYGPLPHHHRGASVAGTSLSRSCSSHVSALDQVPTTLNASASFSETDTRERNKNSLLVAIDKRIKAQEANIMAPVSF